VAKKEAVGLQMEAVYRARLQEAYTQARYIFFHIYFLSQMKYIQKLQLTEMK
jgi:hypothetical protein